MNKQIRKIEKIGVRLRKNGEIYLFSSKADREQIMKFCNICQIDNVDMAIENINKVHAS